MNFRRSILALGALALFTSLASAQVVGMNCIATPAATPTLRAEGLTELIGDILLSCTGGTVLADGATVQTSNILISLNTNVTSRLFPTDEAPRASEAMLLIDEPNTGGTSLPFNLCARPDIGSASAATDICQQMIATTTHGAVTQGQVCTGTDGATCTAAKNVFRGLVIGNQIMFQGVPVNPPGPSGTRIFRIKNVRANASQIAVGPFAGTTPITASISTSGSATLPVINAIVSVGFPQNGLSREVRNSENNGTTSTGVSFPQCSTTTTSVAAYLRFKENFGTAFKLQTDAVEQSNPTGPYKSESGLFAATGLVAGAGKADFATRIKAVFKEVPAGVRIFVATENKADTNFPNSVAELILSETSPADVKGDALSDRTVSGVAVREVTIDQTTHSGVAIWEVTSTNTNSNEQLDFGVYVSITPNPGADVPHAPSTATVSMSYAPTYADNQTHPANFAQGASYPIPRFYDPAPQGNNFMNITLCQTTLLFPFVTAVPGFDTGLAIANTTSDPDFGTRPQKGSCTLHFYGSNAPAAVTTPTVESGTVWAQPVSGMGTNFQGYVIAVCNFQLAHGYAAVSDTGVRNFVSSYLALVLNTGTGARNINNENLNQ